MAKFINNSATATIARRAAACGLNLAVVAEAIKTASANYASTAQEFPANPHVQTEDWEWADQVHIQIHCEGYALYSGIRADVARLLDIPLTNDLHWAFDHALRSLQEANWSS